ncbi:hypothetical protein T07_4436 [Trichinella nelsoni]|uniref:Peptidase S1 domain-containing protein n=1 Tax=Trichinella nelsoni TaxID=6336 RepID=A0A0V0SJX0_9BILA|nr:hypothetical protein T07_4436 [Trichinella nelsoni]
MFHKQKPIMLAVLLLFTFHHPIVAVECGMSYGPLNVGPYITVFYTSTIDGFFVDCVGIIVSSNSNDTTNGSEIEDAWFPDSDADIISGFNLPPINLAVVKLNQELYFNSKVSPICLPNQDEKPPANSICYYYQFYNGTDISYHPIKMSVFSEVFCQSVIGIPPFDPKTQICCKEAQNYWNTQVEYKPSLIMEGSPLICIKNNKHFLYGIYSWLKIQKSDYPIPKA